MRRAVARALVAAGLATVLVAALAGPAGAAAHAAGAKPLSLASGATVRLVGSSVSCTATGGGAGGAGAGGRGVLCGVAGPGGAPRAGSLGVALSGAGEALVVRFTAKGVEEAWRVPALHRRAAAPAAGAAAPAPRTVGIGGSFAVASTSIRCDVKSAGTLPGVVCSQFAADGLVRPDSNSVAMTAGHVGIYRFDKQRRAVLKVEKAEPAAERKTQARRHLAARTAPAARSAATPIPIGVGDTLQLPGSRLACVVTQDGSLPAVFCLLSRRATPLPKSYAVGLAKDGTAIVVAYDAKSRGSLLRRYTQAVRAPRAAAASGRVVVARFGNVYRVAGTDILCSPLNAGAPGIACTMNGPKGRIVGSAGIALVDGVLARVFQITGAKTVKTLIEKAEPGA